MRDGPCTELAEARRELGFELMGEVGTAWVDARLDCLLVGVPADSALLVLVTYLVPRLLASLR